MSSDLPPDAAAVLESMTLLATLSTAATLRESVAQRRAGRDPSAHAPPDPAAGRPPNAGSTRLELVMQMALSPGAPEPRGAQPTPHHASHLDLPL